MIAILEAMLELLFPPPAICGLCGRPLRGRSPGIPPGISDVCSGCLRRLPFIVAPFCMKCGKPLRAGAANKAICSDCQSWGRFFQKARAVGVYDGILKEHIHALKYRGQRRVAGALGSLMAGIACREQGMDSVDLIVPVPLDIRRLAERGFNQAELIARCVGQRLGIPVSGHVLIRPLPTPSQSRLPREDRRHNLRGAFQVVNPGDVAGRAILLVDDVLTTGATADECSRVLLKAGAREVYVLTAAAGAMEKEWRHRQWANLDSSL